jgi:thiol-disulfide isomerase/thioredoxin
MRRSVFLSLAALAFMTPAVATFGSLSAADDIIREGTGDHRAQLNRMELSPFPADAWAKLSNWTNGSFAPAALSGKVVLIVNWTDYIPASKRAIALAKRLSDKYGKEGLVVVAAHGVQEWSKATKPVAAEGNTLLVAHDDKGDFRKSLLANHDPSFYLIDRAGQLRFADVATDSVEPGISMLLKETADAAASVKGGLAADAAKKDAELRRTASINDQADLRSVPAVEFEMPKPDVYKSIAWPVRTSGDNNQPVAEVTVPKLDGNPGLISTQKLPTKGKAFVLYFWHPDARLTYDRAFSKMDLLQRQHARDLVVVGVVSNITDGNTGAVRQENVDEKAFAARVKQFIATRTVDHSILMDPSNQYFSAASGGTGQNWQGSGRAPFPYAAVVSSDNVIRWAGWLETDQFNAAVNNVLSLDPAIKARRAAEDALLRSKNK